jgi:Protein of unknown function (DUF742)
MTDDAGSASVVRPYVVTGGRVRATNSQMPMETLMEAAPEAGEALRNLPTEKREILAQVIGHYVSVAEVSSHVGLPLGVVRVLISDLSDEGLLTLHQAILANDQHVHSNALGPTVSMNVLEKVLNGISLL